jgi:hypothetical protein
MAKTRAPEPKPRESVYTGMLIMSFLVLAGISVMMYMEYGQYKKAPDKVNINVPGLTASKTGVAK